MSNYTVKEILYERLYGNDPPTIAHEFIEWLSAIIAKAPPEYRGAVWIELDASPEYDSARLDIEIGYNRPETDAEIECRARKALQRQAESIAQAKAILAKYRVTE